LLTNDEATIRKWKKFIYHLLHGLNSLPFFSATVYRGIKKWYFPQDKLEEGLQFSWNAFTSFTTSKQTAEGFAGDTGVLFVMTSKNGRAIESFSAIPSEREVLCPACTMFEIQSWTKVGSVLQVNLKVIVTPQSDKVVLWVDDQPTNNIEIVQELGCRGISVVQCLTTEEAVTWMGAHPKTRQRPLTGLRVISDMSRVEKEVLVPTAGIDLIKILREKFDYKHRVMIYTSDVTRNALAISKLASDARMFFDGSKDVTVDEELAKKWALFGLTLPPRPKPSPSSSSSSSSALGVVSGSPSSKKSDCIVM